MVPTLAVEGLAETLKGLRRADRGLPRAISRAHRKLVVGIVKPAALRNLASQASPKVPNVRGVIGHFATQAAAGLILRNRRYPWAAGGEFGSIRFPQFRRWVGNQYTGTSTPGYLIGSAIQSTLPQVEAVYTRTVVNEIMEAIR